ncbi:MAG: hypothetical protein ACOC1P_05025 [Minisyncoccales bacterium]
MVRKYNKPKLPPLTEKEIKERYEDILDEKNQVLEWEKEETEKLNDSEASPQKKAAAKRALKKVQRRKDTVDGQIIYWKHRVDGYSHFKSSIEMHEYWAKCKERNKEEMEKEKN